MVGGRGEEVADSEGEGGGDSGLEEVAGGDEGVAGADAGDACVGVLGEERLTADSLTQAMEEVMGSRALLISLTQVFWGNLTVMVEPAGRALVGVREMIMVLVL